MRGRGLLVVAVLALAVLVPSTPAATQGPATLLSYRAGDSLWSVAPTGDTPKLVSGAAGWDDADWSADGTRFAFEDARQGDEGYDWEIYVASADGEILSQVTNNTVHERSPAWSPDGKRIAYSRGSAIWTMASDGTDKQRMVDLDHTPTGIEWSPNGRRLAFENPYPASDIGTVRADGTDLRYFATDVPAYAPVWSPDSSELAFAGYVAEPQSHAVLMIMSLDGTDQRAVYVADVPSLSGVGWSPEGDQIAFGHGHEIWAIPVVGGQPTVVVKADRGVSDLSWFVTPQCTEAGTPGADVLTGTPGDDIICADAGNDRILASAGADLVLGGRGVDKIDYREVSRPVVVDLRAALITFAGDNTNVLGVESALGGSSDDIFFGDDARNVFAGYGGNDALIGRGGDDTLSGGDGNDVLRPGEGGDDADGGLGSDTVSFADAGARVRVNLGTHVAFGQGEDIVLGLEKVVGSDYDDFIVGDGGRDVLKGGDGDDTLDGQAGPDDIYGGDERDFLYGRDGADELYGDDGGDYADGGDDEDRCYSADRMVSC